jgi:hypothetical protein
MQLKISKEVRWFLALVSAALGFALSFIVTLFGGAAFNDLIVFSFCPPDQIVSGSCMEPQWVNDLGRNIPTILGASLAAVLVVLFGAFAAPSRKRYVPWIFYGLGAIFAVFLICTSHGFHAGEWTAAATAFICGAVVSHRLNRWKITQSSTKDA